MSGSNLPSYPWVPRQKLGALQLDAAIKTLQNQIDNYAQVIGQLQISAGGQAGGALTFTEDFGGGQSVVAGTYIVDYTAAVNYTVNSFDYTVGDNGGSFTAAVQINGTNVTGLESVSVSDTTKTTSYATANNQVQKGDTLSIVISNVTGSPKDAAMSVNATINGSSNTGTTQYVATTDDSVDLFTDGGDQLVWNTLNGSSTPTSSGEVNNTTGGNIFMTNGQALGV